ncbi:MAG TPA: cation:proton antiporter, partial [Wolbachia sp.]|nr:cation:proton antiporter [Wolbachia sp.]
MIGTIFIALGVFFIVVANIGIFRFPSFYTRLHAAGIADSSGVMLLLIGFALQNEFSLNTIKILLLILTIWIANSTNSYVLARIYYKNEKGNGLLLKSV